MHRGAGWLLDGESGWSISAGGGHDRVPCNGVETGDETLDYSQAVEKYTEANCLVRQGGNHSYENYLDELPLIFEFLLSRIKINAR